MEQIAPDALKVEAPPPGKGEASGGRRRTASTLPVRGGRREMKAFAVTEDELENLGLISLGSTASFSVASFLAAFCLSVWTSKAFSTGVSPETVAYWDGLCIAAPFATILLLILGVALICMGKGKIRKIKDGTDHS
jgi:hypothetical protein